MKKGKKSWNPLLFLVGVYLFISFVGMVLLKQPFALENGIKLAYIDTWFVSVSALCVVGFTTVPIPESFSLIGEIILLVLIQIGGIGFMTIAAILFSIIGKGISLKDRRMLKETFEFEESSAKKILRKIVSFVLTIEMLGAVVLAWRYAKFFEIKEAVYYGVFHSISNFNNAGFDVVPNGMTLKLFEQDGIALGVNLLLVVLGGLGFIVLSDVFEIKKRKRWSLHTKVTLIMTFLLLTFGSILLYITEFYQGTIQSKDIVSSVVYSIISRTDGMSYHDVGTFGELTLVIIMILMFIGGGSGSTAGGIKVSTFALLLKGSIDFVTGKKEVVMFKKRIEMILILKAFVVFFVMVATIMLSTIVTMLLKDGLNMEGVLFEVTAALTTTGFSVGVIQQLNDVGLLFFSGLMILGRIGLLMFGMKFMVGKKEKDFKYTKERIVVG